MSDDNGVIAILQKTASDDLQKAKAATRAANPQTKTSTLYLNSKDFDDLQKVSF